MPAAATTVAAFAAVAAVAFAVHVPKAAACVALRWTGD